MRIKKSTIIFAMAAMLTVLLLNGCGKDRDPSQTDGAGKTQTTKQESDVAAPEVNETEEEKTARLEAELAELGSIEKAEITKEQSGYHVAVALNDANMDDELRDVIITKLTSSYKDLKEDQIEIEVQEREEN